MRSVLLGTMALVFVAGCGADGPALPAAAERLGMMRGGITGGTLDTTHQSVVALFGNQSACTATIVAVSGNQGFALSAAHCMNNDAPQWVVQGNDYNSLNSIAYPVVDYQAHPSYNGQVYDFGMVQFSGASANTPITPAMTAAQDNLGSGSQVTFVGYGQTENGPTSQRHKVGGILSQVSALLLEYDQPNGGPCNGDSGGPSMSVVGGQEYVSGVTSFGDQSCFVYGASGRVSAVWTTFIEPFITGGGGGMQTCDQCIEAVTSGNGVCVPAVDTCLNDPSCEALLQCFNACPQGDQNCYQGCAQSNQGGVPEYNAIIDCLCDTGCTAECAAAPACMGGGSSSAAATAAATTTGSGSGSGGGAGSGAGGGDVGVGSGASTGDPSGSSSGDSDDDDGKSNRRNDSFGGCAIDPVAPPAPPWMLVAAAAGVALASRRRRRAR